MFNWKKKTALLLAGLAMAGSAFAADVPLALDAKQFEARNGAKVNWKTGFSTSRFTTPSGPAASGSIRRPDRSSTSPKAATSPAMSKTPATARCG